MTRRRVGQCCLVLALLNASLAPEASALVTAFTYQGQLQEGGDPTNGSCDFEFRLWDARGSGAPPTGGNQIGGVQTAGAVNVTNGVFTLPLDFGAAAFSSASDRWLQVAVRCPAGSGSYQTLAPRQPLTPAPFALFANAIADGSVSTTKLAPGAVTTSQLATNAVTAAQIADGTITTNDLASGAVSTAKIGDGQVTGAKLVAPLRLTSSVANTTIGAFDGTSTGLNGVGVSGTGGNGADAAGVSGVANAGTGVFGRSNSGIGVSGQTSTGIGVFGEFTGPPNLQLGTIDGGAGVVGESNNGDGVRGFSRNGVGVFGEGTGDVGVWGLSDDDGVFGESTGSGDGVSGVAGDGAGVHGQSTNGTGVLGEGIDVGVHGIANGDGANGVFGESDDGVGVSGESQHGTGVGGLGAVGVGGLTLAPDGIGVAGTSLLDNDADAVGVNGSAKQGIGVRGESQSGYAGLFAGPVLVGGVLTAGVKLFKIDHPLDPANKYLVHAAVESPEMKNIYDGVVVLDTNGESLVELPEWFEALNRDFRYQLTCIGGVAPVYVADEVGQGHFRIAGGTPGLKVSWQVTGVRKDAFAVAHPLATEPEKTAKERGRYLYPVEMGAPASLSVDRKSAAIQ